MKKTNYVRLDRQENCKEASALELDSNRVNDTPLCLPKPSEIKINDIELRTAIERRASIRKYSNMPISMEELSYLLWCTQGVRKTFENNITLRNVPSAGACHAFETYLLVSRVDGLQPGIYRFLALSHNLLQVNIDESIADRVTEACLNQSFIKTSAVTFIWIAVTERMTRRYGERGYRYMYLDAGHVCQNLYLSAESINCGVCAVAAFSDNSINRILDLDGENQFVIYIASVGKV